MAKGYDLNQERIKELNSFGRELARRSKSKCELCEANGVKLSVFEVPPIKENPDIEKVVFLCESCINLLSNIKKAKENDFRFLNNSMWSETPMVKALSIYLLETLSNKTPWASDLLENAYITEEDRKLIDEINFEIKK